jgi:hypothetical protein
MTAPNSLVVVRDGDHKLQVEMSQKCNMRLSQRMSDLVPEWPSFLMTLSKQNS